MDNKNLHSEILKPKLMKAKTTNYVLLFLFVFISMSIYAQNKEETSIIELQNKISTLEGKLLNLDNKYKPGKSLFLLRGYAHSGLISTKDEFTFDGGSFNPIFIYKQSDRLLFESELELELEDGELKIGLEYANISYLLSKDLTLRLGKILTPFGIYATRLHPAWINKFSSNPLGVGHEGVLPTSDIGIELSGAKVFGALKFNYSFYVLNGPKLNTGDDEPEEAGKLHYAEFPDNNKNKAIGGRIGVFPFTNSSLEFGFSGMYGNVGDPESIYEDVKSNLWAIDLSYVKNLLFLNSVIDVKAQYSNISVDEALFESDEHDEAENFENESNTFYGQLSIRPSMVEDPFFRNLELAARYSTLVTPEGAEWESDLNRWELGLNYWLDWRTVLKFTYQVNNGTGGHDANEAPTNAFFVHWAIGF